AQRTWRDALARGGFPIKMAEEMQRLDAIERRLTELAAGEQRAEEWLAAVKDLAEGTKRVIEGLQRSEKISDATGREGLIGGLHAAQEVVAEALGGVVKDGFV